MSEIDVLRERLKLAVKFQVTEDISIAFRGVPWQVPNADKGSWHRQWAITVGDHSCLGADGLWDWEPTPSNRGLEWCRTHRFTLDEAFELVASLGATQP